MWAELVKDLLESVLEAGVSGLLEERKCDRLKKKLQPAMENVMAQFVDSSLDCPDFHRLVRSGRFACLLQNFFFSVSDQMGSREYVEQMEVYICQTCPSAKLVEVREFLKKLRTFYQDQLYEVIAEDPKLQALFHLLIRAHRDIIARIAVSEKTLLQYLEAQERVKNKINDADVAYYHSACETVYAQIRFTGISGAESKRVQNINNFYVENSFSYYYGKEFLPQEPDKGWTLGTIGLKDFFCHGNKVVLIGGAGLGKSTTLNYLFCNYEALCGAHALKIKIDLKEFAEDVGRKKKNMLWCLATEFYRRLKMRGRSLEDAERILEMYLEEGKCLVIFDALDEIPTQTVRNKVRNEIDVFCGTYYLNRVIISTREVGYLRNQFDDSFLHIRINEFDDEQISKYSRNWYAAYHQEFPAVPEGTEDAFQEFWTRFQAEVERADCQKLIRNPIMLILALVIFDMDNNLPNRRVEFYKKCIHTFLSEREKRKAAVKLSALAENILGMDLVLPQIAHYKFSHVEEDLSYRFTDEQLKESIFLAIEVEDRLPWVGAVCEYKSYLIERTELLREVDEDVLDFAHKTFYEYFLAVYFSRMYKGSQLKGLLGRWIGDANYDEMARLIIEVIIQYNNPQQHREVVEFLFSRAEREDINAFSVLEELYAHNILQPKFHAAYYKCILYHPRSVWYNEWYINKKKGSVQYDSERMAETYCREISGPEGFAKTLDALFFLNQEFRDYVKEKAPDDKVVRVADLMSLTQRYGGLKGRAKDPRRLARQKELLEYFLDAGLSYTLMYPEIFLAILSMMLKSGEFSNVQKMLNVQFEPTYKFSYYIGPELLYELLEQAVKSSEQFLLLLVSLIYCAVDRVNKFFGYGIQQGRFFSGNSRKRREGAHQAGGWVWSVLYRTADYTEFREAVAAKGLYSPKFEALYEELYKRYQTRERGKNGKEIEAWYERFVREK